MRHIVRIKRLIIKKSGPLHNLDITFSPVTLIIGDNERGKTRLLNWIGKGLFEKPNNSSSDGWSDQIGGTENVQMSIKPFYQIYDGERMKNLLFIQETDLLLKYKNPEEISKKEYWNNEIQTLLYGQDSISDQLQNSFLKAMGVGNSPKNSWLIKLHDSLHHLKSTLDELIPDIEMIRSKELGLFELNNSLGKIEEEEQEINSKEELYFLADKIAIGKKYIDLISQKDRLLDKESRMNDFQEYYHDLTQELQMKEDSLFDIEDRISESKIATNHFKDEEQSIRENPMNAYHSTLGKSVLNFFIGFILLTVGVFFAFQSMTAPHFNLNKILALCFFLIGVGFIIKTLLKEFSAKYLAKQEKGSFIHERMIAKAQKKFLNKYQELENLEREYTQVQQECKELRRKIKTQKYQHDTLKFNHHQDDLLYAELQKLEDEVDQLYKTTDSKEIFYIIENLEKVFNNTNPDFDFDSLKKIRVEKKELLEKRGSSSHDYERVKSRVLNTIKPLLEELKAIGDRTILEYFYPEVMQLEIKHDFSYFYNLFEDVDALIDQVSKDRYLAEKLTQIYQNVESNSESLISKTLNTSFFNHLIQNIFDGKYKSFRAVFNDDKAYIYAETGDGEIFPLESLSAATCTQFWLILRLTIAKTILGKEEGIILLDDPFSTFDTLRKRNFVELLNAFAHEGWQIICTLTDDKSIYDNFQETFGDIINIIDLNRDFY